MSKSIGFIAIALLAASPFFLSHPAVAGDNGHPIVNSIGRFWGVGYSHQGYQAAPGRLNIVRQLNPASKYASSSLLAPYHQSSYALPQMAYGPAPYASQNSRPSGDGQAEPRLAPKPVGPPPSWLEPYLNDESKQPISGRSTETIELESPSGDPSPSDKATDDLLIDSEGTTSASSRNANRYR